MGHFRNISPTERRRLDEFRQDRLWREWISTLHPNTKKSYESGLFNLLGQLQLKPTELVQLAGNTETQKDLSKRVKVVFAQLAQKYSYSARNIMLAALKNFLALNEIILPLIGFKIKLERKTKPLFTWQDAERVIAHAQIEYQPAYRVMSWALDPERFIRLNADQTRISEIKTLLQDKTKDWIKIDVPEGRKSSPPFYLMVPRNVAELLPVLDQDGAPIVSKNSIFYHWRNALHRAGFKYEHFGPHNMRSSFTVEATKRGLNPVLIAHQKGHDVDSENYQRIQQDEAWVTEQFRKAWQTQPLVTEDELEARDSAISDLKKQVFELQKYVIVNQLTIEAAGGYEKMQDQGLKAGLFRERPDGSLETTDKMRSEIEKRSKHKP